MYVTHPHNTARQALPRVAARSPGESDAEVSKTASATAEDTETVTKCLGFQVLETVAMDIHGKSMGNHRLNHRETIGKWLFNGILMGFDGIYPLVMTNIAVENHNF